MRNENDRIKFMVDLGGNKIKTGSAESLLYPCVFRMG